ncbi:PAS domain S-box protein (plasmid) [Halorussus limi]|uniref:histidine kinase n=1 Tax=Halorussus limi TaxID=2938695 RepID=A0A8U0HZ45_9EURY|nr:PAS domain S-box protein [Halorussus limi]UPV76405.1 PAS domain S-box protein [Halorussus limi]
METSGPSSPDTFDDVFDVFTRVDVPGTPLTASEIADELGRTPETVADELDELVGRGALEAKTVGTGERVWWRPPESSETVEESSEAALDQAQFRNLVEAVTDYAIFVLDREGRVQTWNEGAKQLKGYDEADILGQHFSNFYTDEDREAGVPQRNIERAVENGRVTDEGWRVRKDGTTFWASVTITAIRDDDGELQGFIKVTRDMTDRHEYEQRLRKEKERFETLVREVKDYAIFLLDADGIVQTWNDGAKQLKGYDEAEIVGQHFSAFYTDEDREAGRPEQNLSVAAEQGRVEDEGKRVRKDGTTFWANVIITALYDDEGEVRGFAKVTRDMTERHEYEQRLRAQRDELDELNQINTVIRDIDQALVTATTREEIEQAVCNRLASSTTYSAAWVGEFTEDYEDITPRTWAGVDDEYLETVRNANTDDAKETEKGVGALALRTGSVQPVQRLQRDSDGEPWRQASLAEGFESAISVPLLYDEVEYGVLTVYADHESAFDQRKIAVLSELGETISHAIAAIRRKEREQTLTALQESTRELLRTETQTEIGDIIVGTLTDDISLADAVVYAFDTAENALEPIAASSRGDAGAGRPVTVSAGADSPIWTSFERGETQFTDSVAPSGESGTHRTMLVPLGEYGVLAVGVGEQESFDGKMRNLVELVAATAEAAFKRTDRERRLQHQNDRLDSFASMLAHELRNPVTIGQIYGRQLPTDEAPEAVDYVTEAFDRIEDMIDVLLVLARGREAVDEQAPVPLADVARDAWEEVEAPDATLEVTLDRTIQADETYVRHLFQNLFENAVEHGGSDLTVTVGELPTDSAGGDSTDGSVGVSSERSEDEARQGAERTAGGFYVADDGVGIPADQRNDIFEIGYTTAAEQGGTGLGLAFVRELAEVYEWDVSVTESEAGGAQFEFRNVR